MADTKKNFAVDHTRNNEIDVQLDNLLKFSSKLNEDVKEYNLSSTRYQDALNARIKKSLEEKIEEKNAYKARDKVFEGGAWISEHISTTKVDNIIAGKLNQAYKSFDEGVKAYQKVGYKIKGVLDIVKNFLSDLAPADFVRKMENPMLFSIDTWRKKTDTAEQEKDLYNFSIYINGEKIDTEPVIPTISSSMPSKDFADMISDKSTTASSISDKKSSHNQNQSRKRNNAFINTLLESGPDLYSNMFDVCLRFTTLKDNESHYELLYFTPITKYDKNNPLTTKTAVYNDLVRDIYSLSVRTATVKIPGMSNEQFSRDFLNTRITGIQSIKTMSMESSLTLDIDSNAYFWEMFQDLAGLHRKGTFNYYNKDTDNNYRILAPLVGRNNFRIDVIVAAHALTGWISNRYDSLADEFETTSKIVYVFEDVKFKGTSTPLSFSNTKTGVQQVDNGFIFKRLHTIYKGSLTDNEANFTGDVYYNQGQAEGSITEDFVFDEDTL